ncbi:MAG TPA: hypothetical protein PKY13_14395 [Microthrixaceae bacterium]|jgi:SAM-dependent methyltransferase|nr:hypothetical protein [Microthrixaceae bacterium]
MILDLGCGSSKRPGAVGVDIGPFPGVDVVHDLNRHPFPFEDGVADEIYLDNVLEHLDDVIATMEELHRIGRDGCRIRIDVPYFRSRWAAMDPTHVHAFTPESFAYFDPTHPFSERYGYSAVRFDVESVVYNERFPARGPRALVARFANRRAERYESYLAPIIPLDELTFTLRVRKHAR